MATSVRGMDGETSCRWGIYGLVSNYFIVLTETRLRRMRWLRDSLIVCSRGSARSAEQRSPSIPVVAPRRFFFVSDSGRTR